MKNFRPKDSNVGSPFKKSCASEPINLPSHLYRDADKSDVADATLDVDEERLRFFEEDFLRFFRSDDDDSNVDDNNNTTTKLSSFDFTKAISLLRFWCKC